MKFFALLKILIFLCCRDYIKNYDFITLPYCPAAVFGLRLSTVCVFCPTLRTVFSKLQTLQALINVISDFNRDDCRLFQDNAPFHLTELNI